MGMFLTAVNFCKENELVTNAFPNLHQFLSYFPKKTNGKGIPGSTKLSAQKVFCITKTNFFLTDRKQHMLKKEKERKSHLVTHSLPQLP